ncbi:hypothetical protein [Actinoalloteichus hymeniacidonis]|uniref:PPE family protein n=1 Tax=Actinoalloteichus hymeniacidonis TaxID=340345 RepID=A0AAC9MWI4_9PSEU|nr:hypothetical protein [Actinoalloteichus hymeniacidonis]AOS61124.1 hypothetical protein TL08_01415 [Actinoalloteichus hymeniacidonis]MBB5910875.1 hypothetical protein [Actinoalloteichus hymeniacidonis]
MSELNLQTTCLSWEGKDAKTIHSEVMSGVDGRGLQQIASDWRDLGSRYADVGSYVETALQKAQAAHTGAAADASVAAVNPLASYATQAQSQAEGIAGSVDTQLDYRLNAMTSVPEGRDEPSKSGFIENVLPSGWTGHSDRMDAYEAENEEARQVMQGYQTNTNQNLMAVPGFEQPEGANFSLSTGSSNPGTSSVPGGGGSYSPPSGGYSGPSGGSYAPGGGSTGGGGIGGGTGGGGTGGGTGGGVWTPPGTPSTPLPGGGGSGPLPSPGPAPGISPDFNGPTPGGPSIPGPGGPGFGGPGAGGPGFGGPGAGGPGFGGPGYGPGAGGGFGPGFGGGFGGPGGGFGGGGFGPGGGAGGMGGAGGPGGVGGPGGPGGAGGLGGPGAPGGAGGAGGGMGGGGARGRNAEGEDDKEHKRADYLVEADDVFGDGQLVAPPVLGERG